MLLTAKAGTAIPPRRRKRRRLLRGQRNAVPVCIGVRRMADISELEDAADAEAAKALSTSADGVSVGRRSLKELDDHIDRVANREAAAGRRSPFTIFKMRAPNALGGCP